MGFDKPMFCVIIVLYLFMSSLACAHTYGTVACSPGLDCDIKTHSVDFSTDVNLSDMDIEVLEGEWHVVDGNLTSMAPVNWFILTDKVAITKGYPITKEYEVYNMQKLTRFTIFYGSRYTPLALFGRHYQHSYWEFDVEHNVLNCVNERTSWPAKTNIYYSAAHNLGGVTDFTIKTYIEKPWGVFRTHVLSELYRDGVKIASAEWNEWMASEVLSCTGGVYTEQPNFKVRTVEGLKRVDVESDSKYSSLALLLKLMLFTGPQYENSDGIVEYVVPLWLNLILFKVPVFALGILILCIVRGV